MTSIQKYILNSKIGFLRSIMVINNKRLIFHNDIRGDRGR